MGIRQLALPSLVQFLTLISDLMLVYYGNWRWESMSEFMSYTQKNKVGLMMVYENWSASLYIPQYLMMIGHGIFSCHDLPKILELMLDFVKNSDNCEIYKESFLQIVNTGLFRDAVGKIVDSYDDMIDVKPNTDLSLL